jgi:hypothetical protein
VGEDYWERRQRHLNEDHEARRRESERTMGLLRSQERIDELSADIKRSTAADGPINEDFLRLQREWIDNKSATMTEISNCSFLSDEQKAAWLRTVEQVILTERDDSALVTLRGQIIREAFKLDPRLGRGPSLVALVNRIATLIALIARARTTRA